MLNYKRNNKDLMLLYNLTAMKNSKMKIDAQNKSREKQKSSVKITLIASKLIQKGNTSKSDFKRG